MAGNHPPPPKRPLTLRDVSEASGVSEMTVSRVLRNRGDVSQATRTRVLEASRRLAQYGFPTVGSLNLMFHAAAGSPLEDAPYHQPERWLMRPAEGDNFFT